MIYPVNVVKDGLPLVTEIDPTPEILLELLPHPGIPATATA